MSGKKFSTIGRRRDEITGERDAKVLLQKPVCSHIWSWTGDGLFLPHAAVSVSGRDHHCGAGDCSGQTQSVNFSGRDLYENRSGRSSKSAWVSSAALF